MGFGALEVDGLHASFVVAVAGGGSCGEGLVNALEGFRRELEVDGAEVVFEVLEALGAGDGDDVVALGEDPCEGELGRGAAEFGGDGFYGFGEVEVAGEVFALEAGVVLAPVVFGDVGGGLKASGEESAAEGRVGDEADAELAAGGEDFVFWIAGPEGVFGLEGRDGMDLGGAAEGGGSGFGHAEVADFSGGDELGHGSKGVFNGDVGIDAVLVVEVDVVEVEAFEAGVAGLADVFGAAVDAEEFAVGAAHVAELGGEDDVVAAVADGAADELLVASGAVHVCGVEEVESGVEGAVDDLDGFGVVGGSVKLGHAHAAEAEAGDAEAVATESAVRKRISSHDGGMIAECESCVSPGIACKGSGGCVGFLRGMLI